MELIETELTPELAARLLASPHPKQRRPARAKVEEYTRAIREGRWRLVADAILVDDEGRMFNGGHRCAAVIAANRSIPVFICWNADPSTFDVIDVGRLRSAYQFISETEATARASAARLTLWYSRRFERPPLGVNAHFDLHELLAETERLEGAFEAMAAIARQTYEYTGIAKSVCLAAFAIAYEMGYEQEVQDFAARVQDPTDLPTGDPARQLSERFRKQTHRSRRRQATEDWTILVRALNLHLEGRTSPRLAMSEFWPRVGEREADYNRRRNALASARAASRRRADDERRQQRKVGAA